MQSPRSGPVGHPAVFASLLHGTLSLGFAVAVCVAAAATLSGLPRVVAPFLMACYTIASIGVMLAGLIAVRRPGAADDAADPTPIGLDQVERSRYRPESVNSLSLWHDVRRSQTGDGPNLDHVPLEEIANAMAVVGELGGHTAEVRYVEASRPSEPQVVAAAQRSPLRQLQDARG